MSRALAPSGGRVLGCDALCSPYVVRPGGVQGYTAFGYPRYGTNPGFTGQWHTPPGVLYMLGNGHRAYSPSLARFLQPDALSPFAVAGPNGMSYCRADPVNRVDPAGTVDVQAIIALAANGLSLLYHGAGVASISVNAGKKTLVRYGLAASLVGTGLSVASLVGKARDACAQWPVHLGWVAGGLAIASYGLRLPSALRRLRGVSGRQAGGRFFRAILGPMHPDAGAIRTQGVTREAVDTTRNRLG